MQNFLITESAYSMAPLISKKSSNTVEFIAVMQEADKPNRNNRIYFKQTLEEALASPYVQERLLTKSFYVECGHPTDSSIQRQMTIDQRNIAAIVKEFWWEGNLLKAKLETADTAVGRDMKGLIEQGSRVAFSLRAQGNVHYDPRMNATIVESPIQIATYDWVVNPSHDKAFLESICEDTMMSLFRGKNRQLALAESVNLFENGSVVSLNEVPKVEMLDYAQHFSKKIKPVNEAYIYNENDKLKVDGKFAILENGSTTKRVMLEDYILKDLRHKIVMLGEEAELGSAAAEPAATSDAAPSVLAPAMTNSDSFPADEHKPAIEVKEVIVEAVLNEDLILAGAILAGTYLFSKLIGAVDREDAANKVTKKELISKLRSENPEFDKKFKDLKDLMDKSKKDKNDELEIKKLSTETKKIIDSNLNVLRKLVV